MTLAYTASEYLVQTITGLGAGAVLFLVASGLTLIFGALRVINFAHGSLFLLGGYFAIAITPFIGFGDATFWIVIILAGLGVALAGIFLEVFFFRPIYNRSLLVQLLVTFSFVLMIAGITREIWGGGGVSTPVPPFLGGGVEILDRQVPTFEFFFMALAVAVFIILNLLLYRTGLGRDIRAAVSDPELLRLSGVNVKLLFTGVFAIGSFFAGLGGAAFTLGGFIIPPLAVDFVILSFVVIVIGGLGSLTGAFIASFLVGIAEAIGILWFPQAAIAIVFAVLVIVLVIRPQGLMGTRVA